MATSKSRLLASTVSTTSKSKERRTAATSSASFFGLRSTRLGFLYCVLPTTSATLRSAQAASVESTTQRMPHRIAIHDSTNLLIVDPMLAVFLAHENGNRAAAGRTYGDRDRFGIDRRIVRHVTVVGQQQLQRMLAGRKRDVRLGLSRPYVQMVEIHRTRPIAR